MGIDQLGAFLQRHRRLAVDSSIFIYQVEANPRYSGLTDRVFEWLERVGSSAVTSTITMAEVLVLPYRESNLDLVDGYFRLLSRFPNLEWVAPDLFVADTAARMRSVYGLRTPDALQAATALASEATGMVTNDAAFERVKEFETLVLDRVL